MGTPDLEAATLNVKVVTYGGPSGPLKVKLDPCIPDLEEFFPLWRGGSRRLAKEDDPGKRLVADAVGQVTTHAATLDAPELSARRNV